MSSRYYPLQAVLPEKSTEEAINLSGEKELIRSIKVITCREDEGFKEMIDCRWWMGRSKNAEIVHCSIWIRHLEKYLSGYGQAGGWGYDKYSRALEIALASAGIELHGDIYGRRRTKKVARIGGVGSTAIEAALAAIMHALGYRKFHLSYSQ